MLLAWNEKKKSYVYVFSWIKSLKVMLPRMCICLGFCDFTSWHHSCYDDDVSSNRKQTMHSHAPIEASIRNPSRRLMQTVSSNPPSNPQWSMKQLRGLQLHKLRFMHLSIISVYISNFIFHIFFIIIIIGYFCNLCLSTTDGRCFLLFAVHFCPLVVRYYWLWKRPASPNASIQVHLII